MRPKACDFVQIGAETHSVCICLPPLLSHWFSPASPSLPPMLPLAPSPVSVCLSLPPPWSPSFLLFVFVVSLPPAAQPLSAWGCYWGRTVGLPASLGQLKGPRLSAGPGSVQPGPREGPPRRTVCLILRASLWSSCVVLPLLALTWMSAVLAMTDRRSVLFQALFAVFNSAQGFVITAVHCFLRREVSWAPPGPRPPLPATPCWSLATPHGADGHSWGGLRP